MQVSAIVLAGGRASRMGGVDKPAIVVGGRTLLAASLAAVADCAPVVVVGPDRPELDPTIRQVREEPAGGGPVAAVAAGLAGLGASAGPQTVLLAADLPFLTAQVVQDLRAELTLTEADAVFAADDTGRPQYLIGVWRTEALTKQLAQLDSPVNQPMQALVPDHTVIVPQPGISDCDTAAQVRSAQNQASRALSLAEAREVLRERLTRLVPQQRELATALGASVAADIRAAEALPRFDVSAMDGYAVAGLGPWRLRTDIGYAGGQRPSGLAEQEAVRIATGAHVPDGTTRVLRDEFATLRPEGLLQQRPDTPERSDVRRRGEDRLPGDLIAATGTPVTWALVSAAAAVEVSTASLRGPLHARVVMTGDEIRSAGPLHAGQTRDTIGPILPGVLARFGIRVEEPVHLRDTADGFAEVLTHPEAEELLIIVGATGLGAADHLRSALTQVGARILVPRLDLRPGGSTLVAELTNHTTVLGLPGNPFAALAALIALIDSVISGRTGTTPPRTHWGPLHNASEISGPHPRIAPAIHDPTGGWRADPAVRTAHLGGLVHRDGLVIVPPHTPDGTLVEFLPLS